MLDTTYTIETPEGVTLNLHVAGVVPRVLAWVIDAVIRVALYFLLIMQLERLGDTGFGIFLIFLFGLEWFYPVLFEVYWNGATIGKKLLKIRVVQTNGLPVDWTASMVRNLLRFVDFLPFFYALGIISMLCNRQFQRLGDLSAGTLVIYHEMAEQTPLHLPHSTALALPIPLLVEEQQAILSFAERAPSFSEERIKELANIVESLTHCKDQAAVDKLYQYATGLIGEKQD